MNVSVIIPAHNSAETVEETLRSLVVQTWPHWEAIVIDDGSTDATADIVRKFIEAEPRVRMIQQPKSGVSAARNNGIDQIRTGWMCFLDADDIFLPDYLQKMTDALAADPTLDAVTCGWARLLPDGSRFDFNNRPPGIDLFEALAHDCVITIHTVVMKVDIVRRAGRFDTSLRTCEDWDLWQRIARCGCRWGRLDDTLCLYRTRPGSASFDASRLIQDSLVVVRRAHEPDPRVTDPAPQHANGLRTPVPLVKQWYHLCWFASLALGRGQESSHLVRFLADRPAPDLEPSAVGIIVADGMLLPALTPPHRAYQLWPKVERVIESFLREVGRVNGVPEFAEQALRAIDREILYRTEAVRGATVGRTALRVLDVCSPIEDLTLPAPIERARIRVELDGKKLDELTLPVVAGVVSGDVIADAIADRCFWPLLGAYFAKTIYPTLRIERDGETASLFRGTFPLARKLPAADPFAGEPVHAAADWTLMLQELFGRPNWPSDRFYDPNFIEEWRGGKVSCNAGRVTVELSRELPDVRTPMPLLQVMPTVGGAPLGVVPIKVSNGLVKAQQIRAAVIYSTGVDLCRAIVRGALVGRRMDDVGATLRRRLATAGQPPAPSDRADLILARRAPVHFNTPATRWAVLPGAAAEAMAALWEAEGHAPVNAPAAGARRVVYDPNLLQQSPDFVPPIPTSLLSRIATRLSRVPSDFATSGLMLGFAPASMSRPKPRRLARPISSSSSARRADVACERIPILMYHRVAPSGADMNRQWRVTPQEFEQQLAHLEKNGYHSVSFESWRDAAHAHKPLPGRGVILTFDDGFVDFAEHAWPLMRKFGFEANMFLVAGLVGRSNEWDLHRGGERVPLMDWNTIRQLQQEGVRFGAHTVTHPHLTGVTIDRCATELVESRVILQRELRRVVNAFAYPFGDHDEAVQHLAGAGGYDFAVTCDGGYANHDNRMLALPRVEVDGKADLAAFAASVQWV